MTKLRTERSLAPPPARRLMLAGVAACMALAMGSITAALADSIVPPPGYYAAVQHSGRPAPPCAAAPPPFAGTLDFPSKYEGSGKSRDSLNQASDLRYQALSKPINDMEKGTVKLVDQYMASGSPQTLACALQWYGSWADARGLLGPAATHTGKSARKWALASLSGAWLRLQFSNSRPLAGYAGQAKKIETWLGQIADTVVSEWDTSQPAQKINNHFYWAAWGVMATSVVTDRRDLFDWSTRIYGRFADAADPEGFLPNELARKTRALGYHNFAITPIAMIAAFGKVNGVDLAGEGGGALERVATKTLQGVDDPGVFESKTGVRQEMDGFDAEEQNSKLAWLEPYCWTIACRGTAATKLRALRPFKNTRLGGDVTLLFAPKS